MDIQIDVEELKQFFVEIGQKLARQEDWKQSREQPKLKKVNQSFFMFSFNVSKIYSHSKNRTSFGHDGLNMLMLKIIAPVLSQHISNVFNFCISIGEFPDFPKIFESHTAV